MFCQKCGTENKDDGKFCSKCGNDLKSAKVEAERKGITGKLGKMGIPGFRSGESWKMILATLVYFFLGIFILIVGSAVIAAFVFGLGGTQTSAPTLSIVASNHPDTSGADIKIQHKGGDRLNGGEWKLSIVAVGESPIYIVSNSDYYVGKQIIATTVTCSDGVVTDQIVTGCTRLVLNKNYNVKLAHIPSNALLVDVIVEVRGANSPSSGVTQVTPITTSAQTSTAKLGDKVVAGDFAYTFNSMTTSKQIGEDVYGTFMGDKADGIFIILDVTIENIGKESQTILIDSYIKIIDDQGRTFKYDAMAGIYLKDEAFSFTQLQPGLPKRGKIVFDVPENINGKIELSTGLWSSDKKYVLLTK
jgi:hypothetical protein